MPNLLVSIVIVAILAGSIAKIVSEKRKGYKCVGCPYSQMKDGHCDCGSR